MPVNAKKSLFWTATHQQQYCEENQKRHEHKKTSWTFLNTKTWAQTNSKSMLTFAKIVVQYIPFYWVSPDTAWSVGCLRNPANKYLELDSIRLGNDIDYNRCLLVQLVTVSAAHFGLMGKRRKCELIITELTRWDNQVKWLRMDFTLRGFNEANIQSSPTAAPSAHQDMMKLFNLMNTSQCLLVTLGGITFKFFLQRSSQ